METTLPCPHCKKPIPDGMVDERGFRKSFCPHCHAPIKFRWLADFAGYFVGLLVAMAFGFLLMPLWRPLIVLNSHGGLDRGSPRNLLFLIPFLAVWVLVERLFHRRFGSLVLANPKWPRRLSAEERKLMREHDIRCNDEYFACGEMHFETLQEAIDYARTRKARSTA